MIGANRQERDFRCANFSNFLKTIEVSAIASVIYLTALVFKHEASVAAVAVSQNPRPPMTRRCQRYFPLAMGKTFPPFQLDHPAEPKVVRQVTHSPGHDSHSWMRQFAQGRLVEVVKVRMRQQYQINR